MTVAELFERLERADPSWEVEMFANDEYISIEKAVYQLDIMSNKKSVILFGVDDDDGE